jgi:NADP-dependent 3-hydroxy acid dehydrogenase YdfG
MCILKRDIKTREQKEVEDTISFFPLEMSDKKDSSPTIKTPSRKQREVIILANTAGMPLGQALRSVNKKLPLQKRHDVGTITTLLGR